MPNRWTFQIFGLSHLVLLKGSFGGSQLSLLLSNLSFQPTNGIAEHKVQYRLYIYGESLDSALLMCLQA